MDSPLARRVIDAAICAVERVRHRLLDLERRLDDLREHFRVPLSPRERANVEKTSAIFKKVYASKMVDALAEDQERRHRVMRAGAPLRRSTTVKP
jgi:hypothetical protein